MGNGEGNTLLILTDDESRLIRAVLGSRGPGDEARLQAEAALHRGIARGTAKLTEEFKAEQQRKKAAKR
jgi:hypothetical protein